MDTLETPKETEDPAQKEIAVLKKQVAHFRQKFQDADADRNRLKAQVSKLEKEVKNKNRALRGQSRKINDIVTGILAGEVARKGKFAEVTEELRELQN